MMATFRVFVIVIKVIEFNKIRQDVLSTACR